MGIEPNFPNSFVPPRQHKMSILQRNLKNSFTKSPWNGLVFFISKRGSIILQSIFLWSSCKLILYFP